VVRFAVRAWFEGPLPAGDYTVKVFAVGRGSRVPVTKKYFVVGD
jgi:hypothetical protein